MTPLHTTAAYRARLIRARDNTDILSEEADRDGDTDVAALLHAECEKLDQEIALWRERLEG